MEETEMCEGLTLFQRSVASRWCGRSGSRIGAAAASLLWDTPPGSGAVLRSMWAASDEAVFAA